MALEVDANVKIKALAFTAAALASFGRKSGKRNDVSQLRLTLRARSVCKIDGLWSDTITVEHGVAGGRKVGARYRQKSRPRCRKRGYDSSFGQIHFPGTESLLERPSFPDRPRLAYEAVQAIVALVPFVAASQHAAAQDLGATRRSCPCDIVLPFGAIRRADRLEGVTERAPELPGPLPEPSCDSAEDHGGYDRGQLNNLVSEVSDRHPEGSSRSPELETRPEIRLHSQVRGATFSFPVPQSRIYAASPRAPAPTTTAIARTATDARRRQLGLDRAAHRLTVEESVVRHLPEQDARLVPTIVQLELTRWLTRERGEIGLRSLWRRPSAWPRRPVARAPSRKEPGGRYPPPAGRRRCPRARDW